MGHFWVPATTKNNNTIPKGMIQIKKKMFPGNRLVLAPSCFFYPRLLVLYSSYHTQFLVKLVSVVGILGAASKNPK